jgi:hypothetical protein
MNYSTVPREVSESRTYKGSGYAVLISAIISSPSKRQSAYWNPTFSTSGCCRMILFTFHVLRSVEEISARVFLVRAGFPPLNSSGEKQTSSPSKVP